jgi:GTPase
VDELSGGAAEAPFRFRVDEAFVVRGKGVWLRGDFEPDSGPLRVGAELELRAPGGPPRPVTVVSWGDGRGKDDQGRPGVFIAVAVTGVTPAEVRPGSVLTSRGTGTDGPPYERSS